MSDGVNVVGYVNDRSGLGEIARLVLTVLEQAAIPHTVIAAGKRPLKEHVRQPHGPYDTNLVCVNAELLPGLVERLGHSFFKPRRTIGFWWWEVDRFPSVMGWSSYLVDELWVGSEHVKKTIEPAVARPVRTFPVPIRRPSAAPVSRSDLGLPADRFAFVFSFNFVSVFERKNPLGLVDAFSRAFAPGEGPILVIKTVNGGQFPRQFEQLHRAAGTNPDVFVIDKSLPAENYHGLVASCDAYASLHRAEGFGLTIAEAMALGKPAVATGYSGNLEFMNERNSYLVPSRLVPIPTGVEPYVEGGFWAEPDLDAAAAALRQVVEDPGEATARAELASSEIERLHGFDAAASFVLERLAADPQTTPPPDELVERAAYELMWGPDLENARPWARMLRQALRPFLRPYVDHQRRVGALVLDAIREREAADRGRATEDESSPVRARKG